MYNFGLPRYINPKKFNDCYIDRYGVLHTPKVTKSISANNSSGTSKETAAWLRFIVLFWSPRVLLTAVKFGTAALIMSHYERLGFAVLMLCFATQ